MLYRLIKRSLACLLVLTLAACKSTFKVQTETFHEDRFPTGNTFKFYNPLNIPKSNFSFSEENKKVIFDAVAAKFQEMGYTSRQDAALLIKIQGGTIAEREVNERYPYMYGVPTYRYPTYNDYYVDISRKRTTLIIEVLNAENSKILWQGVGTGEMGKRSEEVEAKLKEAIDLILAEFPAQKKKNEE